MDLKGQKMLKVCSILMIIGAALALLVTIMGFVGIAALDAAFDGEISGSSAYLWLVVALVAGAIQLVAGIVGIQAAKMPSVNKIKLSLIFGLIVVVLSLISSISSIVSNGFSGSAITGLLIGLVIPALYLVGLMQYKNALVALLSGD